MDKRAKHFTKRIAERLSKEKPRKSGKYKALLIKSIQNVTKDSLKKTLEDNLDLYLQYFNKCLKRSKDRHNTQTDGNDIKLVQSWHDCKNLSQLNKEDKRQICVSILLQKLENAEKDLVSLVDQFEGECNGEEDGSIPIWMTMTKHLLGSTNNMTIVTKLMLYYLVKLLPVAEECLESGENVDCILASLKQFLVMAHLRANMSDPSVGEIRPKRSDILASLLSIFIDLLLYVNRDNEKKKVTREISGVTSYLLGGDWSMRLDVLIQVNSPVSSANLIAFARSCLEQTPTTMTDCASYLKLMICLRKFKDHVQDVVEQSLKIRAPLGFIDWLTDKSPEAMAEIPDDVRFKGRQITYFLLNHQSKELQYLLEDVLTDQEFVSFINRDEVNVEKGAVDDEVREMESDQLFVMDRKRGDDKILSKKKIAQEGKPVKAINVDGTNIRYDDKEEGKINVDNNDEIEVVDLSNVLDAIYDSKPSKSFVGTDLVSNSSQDSPKEAASVRNFKVPPGKVKKALKKKKNRIPDDTIVLDTETSSDAEEKNGTLMAPDLLQHLKLNNQGVCIVDDDDDADVEIVSPTKKTPKNAKKLDAGKSQSPKFLEIIDTDDEEEKSQKTKTSIESEMIDLTSDKESMNHEDISSPKAKSALRYANSITDTPRRSPSSIKSPRMSKERVTEINDAEDSQPDKAGTESPTKKISHNFLDSDGGEKRRSSVKTGSQQNLSKRETVKTPEVTVSEKVTTPLPFDFNSPVSVKKAKSSSPFKSASSSVMKMTEYVQEGDSPAGKTPDQATRRKGGLSISEMGSIIKEAKTMPATEEEIEGHVIKRKRRSSKLDHDDADIDIKTPRRGKKESRKFNSNFTKETDSGTPSDENRLESQSVTLKLSSEEGSGSDTEKSCVESGNMPKETPSKRSRRLSERLTSGKNDTPNSNAGKTSDQRENVHVVSPGQSVKTQPKSTPTRPKKRASSASESEESQAKVLRDARKSLGSPSKTSQINVTVASEPQPKNRRSITASRSTPGKDSRRLSQKLTSSKIVSDDAENRDAEEASGQSENADLACSPSAESGKTPKATPIKRSRRWSERSASGKNPNDDSRTSEAEVTADQSENTNLFSSPNKRVKSPLKATPDKPKKSVSSGSDSKEPSVLAKVPRDTKKSVGSPVKDNPIGNEMDTSEATPKRRRSVTASKSTPGKDSIKQKGTPTSGKKTPRRSRSIIDSPMITRSGKKINMFRKRTVTPDSEEVRKFLPEIQEDNEDTDSEVVINSPSKQSEKSTPRRSCRKLAV